MNPRVLIAEDDLVEAQARDWLLRLNAGDADEAACAAWRATSPRHERAFREASLVWHALGRTHYARDDAWRPARSARNAAVRWGGGMAIAASLALAVVIAPGVLSPPDQSLRTAVAQTRAMKLADGSEIYVGARSAVDVRMGADSRSAVLRDGEAFFEVANDPDRPFTVYAGDTVLRVKGTKFNVRRTPGGVQVSVLEGKVEVSHRSLIPLAAPRAVDCVLTAGEEVRLTGRRVASAPTPVTAEPDSWRRGRVQYRDAPLREVVADANRYSARPIRLGGGDIGDLQVTVSFRTTAVDELIANLDAGLPVAAARGADGDVVFTSEEQGG
jgi:transmembrane sensor